MFVYLEKKSILIFSAVGTTFLLMNDIIGKSFVKVPEWHWKSPPKTNKSTIENLT